ncbi:phosphatidylcholine transfer protein, putative [Entamoeba dispar SAW760]|uniref:START domain-containing protein 10 n=1 Tax=Entamoeba dispar (strain ATCC PRA-260 / SAW760) TaxID=370354 RepID=B0EM87_ENTDS|nr:phosphatidylcholine transfer protein, putative [Entamoeba dispar SAW760]EDR24305.1 phosphatidylcholine transfer protein, putative [Entamoeba dispar SAW760]|eukprot:EDR24305.1 phosphatidylcholine transfer protein, putative [Entamoeba dispar SAW760]
MSDWMVQLYGDVYTLTNNPKYPVPSLEDFMEFKKILDDDEGWKVKQDKNGTKVLFRDAENEEILQVKLKTMALHDIPAEVLHDVVQDPAYRTEWDTSMKSERLIEQIDENTEIGYYSVKMPFTIKNRDWVNMRSWWFNEDKSLFIIINHSVEHEKAPVEKDFIRAKSLKTGYIIEKTPDGTKLSFFSWNAWNGWIPHWCVNKATKTMVADCVEDLRKASAKYPEWKKANHPEEKYWMKEGRVILESKKKLEE